MALGRAINWFQKFWSTDNESMYSHAGIILNEHGDTFESLWKIRRASLAAYEGDQVIIGQIGTVPGLHINDAIRYLIRMHNGQIYPFWRLPMAMLKPLSKYIAFANHPMCSELTAKYLKLAGVPGIGLWSGKTPDDIADMIRKWDAFEVIFEGRFSMDMLET